MDGSGDRALLDRGDALFQISLAINARLELREILEKVVIQTRFLLGCEDASIVLWDARQGVFKSGASTNIGPDVHRRVRRERGASRWVVDHGKPVIVPDARQDPFTANPMIPEKGVLAYAGIPIRQGEETLGVLYALYRRRHEPSATEIWLLEQLAALAAIAVQNARLLESLRDLSEFKGAMIRLLVHDLNNLIQGLRGGVELLRHARGDIGAEDAGLIDASLLRMEQLVEGVVRYEKISSVETVERRLQDANAIAAEAVFQLSPAAAAKSQRLRAEIPERSLPVRGDRVMLREAAVNLVANAVKYTPAGGWIAVRSRREGDEAVLEVEDNGPGIPPAYHQTIFPPFVRLETVGAERGSGLGLHLVKTIAERHGGSVSLSSCPGKGSVFSLRLPAV